MTYPLPTDTQHVTIESRQYRLFNMDLGEGLRRQAMLVVALIVVPWWVLLGVFGVSVLHLSPLYIAPPALTAAMALRIDLGGRPSWAKWLDRWRWLMRKGRPMVAKPGGGEGISPPFIARAQWVVLDARQIEQRVRRSEGKRKKS